MHVHVANIISVSYSFSVSAEIVCPVCGTHLFFAAQLIHLLALQFPFLHHPKDLRHLEQPTIQISIANVRRVVPSLLALSNNFLHPLVDEFDGLFDPKQLRVLVVVGRVLLRRLLLEERVLLFDVGVFDALEVLHRQNVLLELRVVEVLARHVLREGPLQLFVAVAVGADGAECSPCQTSQQRGVELFGQPRNDGGECGV